MSTLIAVPDELVEQVRSVAAVQALDDFFIDAARRQVRQIRARQLSQEFERNQERRTPAQVYASLSEDALVFESKYGRSTEQYLSEFESGRLDEDANDWNAFYRWRTLAYGLKRLEQEYGFTRKAYSDDGGTD